METAGHRRRWEAVLAMALFLGVHHSAYCVHFEVTNSTSKTTCIMADLNVNFTVEYKAGSKQGKAAFVLPASATAGANSTCGLLDIVFGTHSLRINFTKVGAQYQVDELVFAYNLSDKTIFPDASENGTKEVFTNKSAISAKLNSVYQCNNPHHLSLENVNITFHNVRLEAYLSSGNYSKNESHCSEDISPTSAPAPSPTTTPAPSPTTVPVTPKQPDVGEYRINGTEGACLLANMGLQLNLTYDKKDGKVGFYTFNIDPRTITVNGTCSNNSAALIFSSNQVYLMFNFALNTTLSKFYLGQVYLNTTIPEAIEPANSSFHQENSSLLYLQTAVHKSYKCKTKQTFQITRNFSIDTYSLQVQPFDVEKNKFGAAVECTDDQNGMLVPIVVGAALAGLVLIVLIAYLIGRKRSHAGYQTI